MPGTLTNNSVHTMRYLRTQRGETVADIARGEGVTVKAVEKSLRMVAVDHALNTTETLQREAISSIRTNIPDATKAIRRMLNAKTLVRETKVIKGKEITKIIEVDDTEVQVKGVNAWKDLLIAMQPKTPGGVNVNVNQSNANMAAAATTTNIRTTTYEDRLRQIRNQQAEFAALPSQVIDAPEAADEEDEDDDPLDNEEDDDADSPAE
jgi:transcriptional regulator with XRE-family HTH domain